MIMVIEINNNNIEGDIASCILQEIEATYNTYFHYSIYEVQDILSKMSSKVLPSIPIPVCKFQEMEFEGFTRHEDSISINGGSFVALYNSNDIYGKKTITFQTFESIPLDTHLITDVFSTRGAYDIELTLAVTSESSAIDLRNIFLFLFSSNLQFAYILDKSNSIVCYL